MASNDDADRINLLRSSTDSITKAAQAKGLRGKQIDSAVDEATGSAPAPAPTSAGPAQSSSSVDFFKSGPKPTPAMQKAKQSKLIEKLRARDKDDHPPANAGDI
jgi:hypothetical protein